MSTLAAATPPRSSRGFAFPARQDRWAQWLFFVGWAVALFYFPSGMLHFYLGGLVYLRDGLMGLHFAASLYFLHRNGLLLRLLRHVWWLAIPAFLMLPAIPNREFTIEAVTVIKWVVLWTDWMILGLLAVLIRPARRPLIVFSVLTAGLLVTDALCGLQEYETKKFLYPMRGEKSALGVTLGSDQSLGGKPRLKGLQRDVFSFANLMAASAVAGLVAASATPRRSLRIVGWCWAAAFAWMLFISGGRSAFFGVAAAVVVAVATQTVPELMRRFTRRALLVWLVVGLGISLYGIGPLTQSVSDMFLKGNRAGDSRSAFMRDANWDGITKAIREVPVVLLSGAPVAALADTKIAPFYHWADNEYLWILYHVGIPGALAFFFFFYQVLRIETRREAASVAFILFLFFIMGEGIARESLTFLGSLPLFFAAGALIAPRTSRSRPSSATA